MSAPTVILSAHALVGCRPDLSPRDRRAALKALPPSVKLGRIPGPVPARCPRLADFLPRAGAWRPPATSSYAAKAAKSIADPFGNLTRGCCVISDRAHSVGLWTANDADSGGEVIASEDEVYREYERICGPGDNGCYITRVLDVAQRDGLKFGGRVHKIAGYVAIDHTDRAQVQAAQHLFGAVCVGFMFRRAWSSQAVWDVSGSQVVGGHDVGGCGYTADGLEVMSWGRIYRMTWRLVASADVGEMYAVLSPDWSNADGIAPSGLDVAGLTRALAELGAGVLPDPTPPTPPTPPRRRVTVSGIGQLVAREPGGPLDRIIWEGAVDEDDAPPPDSVTIQCGKAITATGVAALLFPVMGCDCVTDGPTLTLHRRGLTPEQWAQLIELITALVMWLVNNSGK